MTDLTQCPYCEQIVKVRGLEMHIAKKLFYENELKKPTVHDRRLTNTQKYCHGCKQTKDTAEFAVCKRNKNGLQGKCKACSAKIVRVWYRANRTRAFEATKRSQEKHPEKYRARIALRVAVNAGKVIKKPCEVCGVEKAEGHHEDYSKPLEVIWLCRKHHMERHYPPQVITN